MKENIRLVFRKSEAQEMNIALSQLKQAALFQNEKGVN